MSVDLPHPLGPINIVVFPGWKSREIPDSASVPANDFDMFSTRITTENTWGIGILQSRIA